jgi:hypothetical protein
MRHVRRKIAGFADESWEVNDAGKVYHNGRRQPITNLIAYLPTDDLGDDYDGPVPHPGCARDCKGCTGESPVHSRSTYRLLEEIVLYAFRKAPPDGWSVSRALHLDGEVWNNEIDNLIWTVDASAVEWRESNKTKGLMRPVLSRKRGEVISASRMGHYTDPYFTDSPSIPGHLPVTSIGAA